VTGTSRAVDGDVDVIASVVVDADTVRVNFGLLLEGAVIQSVSKVRTC